MNINDALRASDEALARESAQLPAPAATLRQTDNQFMRGLDAGALGLGSSLMNAGGLVAGAVGADDAARSLQRGGDSLAADAQRQGPRVGSFSQLRDEGFGLRNSLDYVAGTLGSTIPSMAIGVGAGLGARTLASGLGRVTAAYAPMEVGDAAAGVRDGQDRVLTGEETLRAGAAGLGSAAVGSLVPAMVGGQLTRGAAAVGRAGPTTLRSAIGRNALEAPLEGATEAAGDALKQVAANPDAPLDQNQLLDSFVGGTVGGGAFAGLGAAGEYAHANVDRATGALGRAGGAVADAGRAAGRAVTGAAERGQEALQPAVDAGAAASRDAWSGLEKAGKAIYDGVADSDLAGSIRERLGSTKTSVEGFLNDPDLPEKVRAEAKRLADKGDEYGKRGVQLWAKGVEKARAAAASVKGSETFNTVRDALVGLKDDVAGKIDRIAKGGSSADPEALATAGPDQLQGLVAEADAEDTRTLMQRVNDMAEDTGVPQMLRERITQAQAVVGTPEGRQELADAIRETDAYKRVAGGIDSLKQTMQSVVGKKGAAKETSVMPEGVQRVIADELMPLVPKSVMEDPEKLASVGSSIRQFIELAQQDSVDVNPQAMAKARMDLKAILGEKAHDAIGNVYMALQGGDAQRDERFFDNIGALRDQGESFSTVADAVRRLHKNGERLSDDAVRRAADGLMAWAGGNGNDHHSKQVMSQLEQEFGKKAPQLLRLVEQAQERANKQGYQAEERAPGMTEKDAEPASPSYYGSGAARRGLMESPAAYRAKVKPENAGFEGTSERELKRAQTENPGAQVRFVTVADDPSILDRVPALKAARTRESKRLEAELPGAENADVRAGRMEAFVAQQRKAAVEAGQGLIEVTPNPNPDALNRAEFDSMRMDTANHGDADHPSRMVVKGEDGKTAHVFDAVAVTRQMMKRINRDRTWTQGDDVNQATRLTRAFSDGYAALSEQFGRVGIKSSTVIGTVNGKPFTIGDARKIERRTEEEVQADKENPRYSEQRWRNPKTGEVETVERPKLRRAGADLSDMTESDLRSLVRRSRAESNEILSREEAGESEQGDVKRMAELSTDIGMATNELRSRREQRETEGTLQDEMRQEGDAADDNIVRAAMGRGVNERGLARPVAPPSDRATSETRVETLRGKIGQLASATRTAGESTLENRPRRAIGQRMQELFDNYSAMSAGDRMRFAALADVDLSTQAQANELRDVVNTLHARYSDRMRATGADFSPPTYVPTAKTIAEFREKERIRRELDAAEAEGSPDPKAVAAKKAAFLTRAASGDQDLLSGIAVSSDVKGMRRAFEALADQEGDGFAATREALRERIRALTQDPDVAYSMQTPQYSTGPVDRQPVLDYVGKVLGNTVATEFADILHAGEFTSDQLGDVIRLSVHSLNPMDAAYHESAHAFFKQLRTTGNQEVANVVMTTAMSQRVQDRLRELLKGQSAALRQLRDPEEAAAYMFQFHQLGQLEVAPKARTVLERIAQALRKLVGVWSNDARALHILDYFSSGKYATQMKNPRAVAQATLAPGRNSAIDALQAIGEPLSNLGSAVFSAGSARLRDSGIPSLLQIAKAIKAEQGERGDPGFIPAARQRSTTELNKFGDVLGGLSQEQMADVLESLQTKQPAATPEARIAVKGVQKLLRQQLSYMTSRGVDVGDLGKDYFPRVWDPHYISKNQQRFEDMLKRAGVTDPERTMQSILASDGNEFGVVVDQPGMQFRKERRLANVPDAEAAEFLSKDLWGTLQSYVNQAARRAEWAVRFGDDSRGYRDLMNSARAEGATEAQLEVARNFARGVNGTLGDTLDPTIRRLMGNAIVYQNIRLLPLAIFSSVVDPMGILVRGGEVGEAWGAFVRGIKEIPKGLKGKGTNDSATQLAMMLGTVENAAIAHELGSAYGQGMTGNTARKINDTFFRFNLMEGFNRSMRVAATEAAISFIQRHAKGGDPHSARWMRELNLSPSDVRSRPDGTMVLSEAEGLSPKQALRVRTAINRWVDGAVLRPDAADKPIWMNDPRFALFAHLKQFVYAFHHTILKRVMHEARNGNYRPAMALASYVPIMIAADAAKGIITGGGDEPEWKKNWGVADYVANGIQRAGLLGVGQFGVDALNDTQRGGLGFTALAGPTIEQITQGIEVIGGRREFGSFALKSMPANALYAEIAD